MLIPTSLKIVLYIIIFLYGIILGSFLNVCIYRIPKKESIVKVRSHCENCGYQLKWFDLVPLFSFLCLGGRCRKCKTKISIQHPLVEVLNGSLYLLVFLVYGLSVESLLYCLAFSALLGLSIIDFRTYEIPPGFNIFLGVLGIIRMITDYYNWLTYLIGFISVSAFLYLLYFLTKGRAIGGGDIKLMAVCGLLLGWKLNVLAFVIGCIAGSLIHVIRMRVSGEGRVLAMGPYLSIGVIAAALYGNAFLTWYIKMIGL